MEGRLIQFSIPSGIPFPTHLPYLCPMPAQQPKINLAIFASGGGSNALKIIEHFKAHPAIGVALVVSNKKDSGVLDIAHKNGIPTLIIQRQSFYESQEILKVLAEYRVDFLVLAGFLWLVPSYLVRAFPRKILNIHPALLPKYGGKGMYGSHVHSAVKDAGETESGMTIHFVNEHYDEGDIVFQASCALETNDSPADIARKVLVLEHEFYPKTIEKVVTAS
jgi:phosphoribosylglycinamide formyltransferase-1